MARRGIYRYHVSPSANRESIFRHGLDWRLMDAAQTGIASGFPGRPETAGIYLTHADIGDARWFARMGAGRRVDVWRVDTGGLPIEDLGSEGGWWLCREAIPPERLELVEVWDTSDVFGELRAAPMPTPPPRRRGRARR